MHPGLKVLFGALMVIVGVYSSLTFTSELVNFVQAVVGPLLILIGAFIIWLESDEWKLRTENGSDRGFDVQQSLRDQQNAEEKETQTETAKYINALDGNVSEVKDRIRDLQNPNYERILQLEKKGKDRKTVKEFIQRRTE